MPTPIAPVARSEVFRARMSAEEVAMVAALAQASGVSGSDVLRLLVREAYASRFGDKKPKPRVKEGR